MPERKWDDREGSEELQIVSWKLLDTPGINFFVLLKPFVAYWRIFDECLLKAISLFSCKDFCIFMTVAKSLSVWRKRWYFSSGKNIL